MAWALVANLTDRWAKTDGVHIYFEDTSTPFDRKKYTHSTTTFIKIGDETGNDAVDVSHLIWWKGNLYDIIPTKVVGASTGGKLTVDRWAGSTTWTNVDTFTAANLQSEYGTPPAYVGITSGKGTPPGDEWAVMADDNFIVVIFGYETTIGFNDKLWCRYTSDGVTWQSGLFSDNREALHGFPAAGFDQHDMLHLPAKVGIAISLTDPGGTLEIYEFVSGTMTERAGQLSGTEFIGQDRNYFWRNSNAGHSDAERSTNLSSWTATADTTVTPAANNLTLPIGWQGLGSPSNSHLWDNGEWAAAVSINSPPQAFLRLDDGTLFAFLNTIWFVQSTKLSGSPGDDEHLYDEAQILYGRDQLTKQPNSPLNGILPGAFLRLGTTAFLGGDDGASAVRVAYSLLSGNGYPSWVDFTGNYPASAVQSLDGTPFGNADDNQGSDSDDSPGGFTGKKGCN